MVSRLHCGAQLALILAQITQPVPVLPSFEGNRNLVTESVFLFFSSSQDVTLENAQKH